MSVRGWESYPTYIATGAVASISIPVSPDHTRFMVEIYVVNDANAKSVSVTFNGDATSGNYSYQYLDATGATVTAGRGTTQNITVATMDASTVGQFTLMVSKPAPGVVARYSIASATYTSGIVFDAWARQWTNTADAITAIAVNAVANNLAAGTRVRVLGSRR